MSFILDAIAKSEQERQEQEVPGAQVLAFPLGSPQQPRRLLPYLLVGALLLNVIVLAIWMQPEKNSFDWFSSKQIDTTSQRDENVIATGEVTSLDQTTSVAGVSSPAIPDEVAAVDNRDLTKQLAAEQAGIILIDSSETTTDLPNQPETARSEPKTVQADDDTAAWVRVEPETLSNKARSTQPAEGQLVLQDSIIIQPFVSSIRELPSDVRRDLPTVVFSGHLYSSNPESSVVFVDGERPVMKGQRIVDEIYLHEITPTGVVVEFRGYLIDVGVLQNWTLN